MTCRRALLRLAAHFHGLSFKPASRCGPRLCLATPASGMSHCISLVGRIDHLFKIVHTILIKVSSVLCCFVFIPYNTVHIRRIGVAIAKEARIGLRATGISRSHVKHAVTQRGAPCVVTRICDYLACDNDQEYRYHLLMCMRGRARGSAKGLACRARVTPASSPASHCQQRSALTSPTLHARGCARPSRAC
jgi:hypothetical protein